MTEQEKMQSIYDWIDTMHTLWTTEYGNIDKAIGWEPNERLLDPLQVEDKDEFIRVIMDIYEGSVRTAHDNINDRMIIIVDDLNDSDLESSDFISRLAK
jgi:hypothetical protein